MISRPVDVAIGGRDPVRVWLRNTWSRDNVWSVGVPVHLSAGDDAITLRWTEEPAPLFDRFVLAVTRLTPPPEDS